MPLRIELKAVERLVYRSEVVALGTFRCPATHPLFHDAGPCTHHTIVFPRTSTMIRHTGGLAFTASSQCATLQPHQDYTRAKISPIDAWDWIVIANDVLFDITRGSGSRPFSVTHVPVDSRTYLRQRRLFESANDENAIEIAADVLGALDERHVPSRRRRATTWLRRS